MIKEKFGFRIGDAVWVKGKYPHPGYEAYVEEFERYNLKGLVCVHMNWDGDGIYVDQKPEHLKKIKLQDLSPSMNRSARALRWKYWRKPADAEERGGAGG